MRLNASSMLMKRAAPRRTARTELAISAAPMPLPMTSPAKMCSVSRAMNQS